MIRRLLTALLLLPSLALATPYSARVIADGAQGYWHLDEPSGTSAADTAGNCGAATYTGTFTLGSAGITGMGADTSVTLDGSTAYVERALPSCNPSTLDISSFANNATASYECWAYITNSASTRQTCAAYFSNGSAVSQWSMQFTNTTGTLQAFFVVNQGLGSGVYGCGNFAGTWVTNTWNHIAGTVKSAGSAHLQNCFAYLNGSQIDTQSSFSGAIESSNPGTKFTMGAWYTGSYGRFLTGRVDEVAVYNVQLTGTQVLNHYNLGINPPTVPSWPYTVRRPILPNFRDAVYGQAMTRKGYVLGWLNQQGMTPKATVKIGLGIGPYLPLVIVPDGRGN